MIRKTIDGYETTVHPSMVQAAIDQGICPAGYDSHITDPCCADRCKVFLDGSYRRGCKDTVDRVLALIDELNDTKALAKATPPGSYLHKTYARRLKGAVKELKGERPNGND